MPTQNRFIYKSGSSSPKEIEKKKLVELFQNAPNKHKPEVSITFYKDNKKNNRYKKSIES